MPLLISIRIEFYNGIVRAVSLPQLVGLCLQPAVNHLSKSDKYYNRKNQSDLKFNADK